MIDKNFKTYLIEINTNPCFETPCKILKEIIPNLIENVLKFLIFKSLAIDPLFPPPSLENWP